MTRVTKLVLDGFKSFGKRTELLFSEKFNCVVGPNGSGKSNIIDGFCFVLGKSSSKQLRAEKASNLIYNGGKTKQPAKTAEVSIFLDNTDKTFPLDEKEIKISRTVKQDGQSVYRINNKTKTRQEILELLGRANIDPDGYNIILQGDIMRFVEMSTIDRRRIIEEIAGIGIYEEKKNQALNELEKVEAKLKEANIVLKERESYLKDLKKDRDQALVYKQLNDALKQKKATLLHKQIKEKEKEIQKIQTQKEEYNTKLEEYQKQIKETQSKINTAKEKIQSIRKEIEQKGEVEHIRLQKQLEQLHVDLATSRTQLNNYKQEINKIDARQEQLNKNLEELEQKKQELTQQKKQTQTQYDNTFKKLTEIDNKIKELKEKHHLGNEIELDKQIETLDKDSEKLEQNMHLLREERQRILREKDRIEFSIQTIQQRVTQLEKIQREHQQEVENLRKTKEQFKKTVLELNQLLNQDSHDANELSRLTTSIQRNRETLAALEVSQARAREAMQGNIAVQKILENKNKLGEIYGTVAELGKTEKKYSLALEVAASNKLHSIVVADDKTAATCINFLKQHKLGIATFLPLNKVSSSRQQEGIDKTLKTKGVHGLALDIVEFEPQFKNIFSHVFGNTIIVEDINIARNIGISKARMVTLDGDLAELSGAMIGGYRHKREGSFQEKQSTQIETVKQTLNETEERQNELTQRRKENEQKISRLRELKANLEGEIIKTEKSLHLGTDDLEHGLSTKEELEKQLNSVGQKLTDLEDQITEETQKATRIKISKQEIKQKISELRNPTVIAELNAYEEQKARITEELHKHESDLRAIEVHISDVIGRESENTTKILKENENEKQQYKHKIETLHTNIQEKENQVKQKEEEQQKFHTAYKALFEQESSLTKEVTANEHHQYGLEEKAHKEEMGLNTLSIEQAKLNAEHSSLTRDFTAFEGTEILQNKTPEELKTEIIQTEQSLAQIGNVNLRALEIYDAAEKEYQTLLTKKEKLASEKNDVVQLMNEIDATKTKLFTDTFTNVNTQFTTIFKTLSAKGEAFLELENPEKPFEEGASIKVKLTGERFLDIRALSGGEKTLTALAFIFAIQEFEPATFYILDEVDAALDKRNSELLSKLIQQYASKAQYIVISHNDSLITQADTLWGVAMNMDLGISTTVGIKV